MKKMIAFLLAILNFCMIAYANGIPEFIDEEMVASIFENEATNSIGSYHIRQVRMKNAAGEASAKLTPSGTIEAVTINAIDDIAAASKLLVALYRNGRVEKFQSVSLPANASGEYPVNMNLPESIQDCKVKIMIWTNALEPLSTVYDTDIVRTETVYSSSLTTGETQVYEFQIPQDGMYRIKLLTGSGIDGSLFNRKSEEAYITVDDMSAGNDITAYLSSKERYRFEVSAGSNCDYSFMIEQAEVSEELELTKKKIGTVNYPEDRIVYHFTAQETAYYIFEADSNLYPYGYVADSSGEIIEKMDNLEYQQNIAICAFLQPGSYLVTFGAKTGMSGSIQIYTKKIGIEESGSGFTINGKMGTAASVKVGLAVYNSQGSIQTIGQTTTGTNGVFQHEVSLSLAEGAYQILLNQEDQTHPVRLEVGNGTIENPRTGSVDTTQSENITVDSVFSTDKLTAGEIIQNYVTIENQSGQVQDVAVILTLLDQNGIVQGYCSGSTTIEDGESSVTRKGLRMPDDVSGMSLYQFIWQGKSVAEGSLCPLADYTVMTPEGITTQSEPIDTAEVAKPPAFEDLQAQALYQEMDSSATQEAIEMNYTIYNEGLSTGGTLLAGYNKATVYYKNKGIGAVTLRPYMFSALALNNTQQRVIQIHRQESVTLYPGEVYSVDFEFAAWNEGYGFWLYLFALDENESQLGAPVGICMDLAGTGAPPPLTFTQETGGTFLYANNHEGVRFSDLSDIANPNPKLLMNFTNLGPGKYTLFISYQNDLNHDAPADVPTNIEIDAQFYAPFGNATVDITALGYDVPVGESWACMDGWRNYMQQPTKDLQLQKEVQPSVDFAGVRMFQVNGPYVDWISNYIANYESVPRNNPMNLIMQFEILEGQVDINVAGLLSYEGELRNRSRHSPYAVNSTYDRDRQYNGVAAQNPQANTKLYFKIDQSLQAGDKLPVTIFNQFQPGGYRSTRWFTHINPLEDTNARNEAVESDMIGLHYDDGSKWQHYGENVPQAERDPVWHFDTSHSDLEYAEKIVGWNGLEPIYELVLPVPPDYEPNSEIAPGNADAIGYACNLANYAVTERYELHIFNYDTVEREIAYRLNTASNAIIIVYDQQEPKYFNKGEYETGVSERIFNMSIPAQRYGVVVFDVILPTGNAGGLENSLEIVS